MSNCSDFLIKKEDHTIGNLVSEHLKHHPHVMMAGYKSKIIKPFLPSYTYRTTRYLRSGRVTDHCPSLTAVAHPNVPELFIRVQTDGVITPKDAFIEVCKNLIAQFAQLGREFTREYELRRMATAGPATNGDGNANGGNGF